MSTRHPSLTSVTLLAEVIASKYNWTSFAVADAVLPELRKAKIIRIESNQIPGRLIVAVNKPGHRDYTLAINSGKRLILRNGGGCLKGWFPRGDVVEITIVE